jgi:hypothetical protein
MKAVMFLARTFAQTVEIGSVLAASGGWIYATTFVMIQPDVKLLPIACGIAFGVAGGAELGFVASRSGRASADLTKQRDATAARSP